MDIFGNFSNLAGDKKKRKVSIEGDLDFSYSDSLADGVGKVETKDSSHHPFWTRLIIIIIFCVLASKLFLLAVAQGDINQKLAMGNRIRPRLIEATRGLILDKNGDWLARNKPSFALAIYPSDLPKNKNERLMVYQKIADITKLPVDQIRVESEKNGLSSLDEVLLQEDISHDDALLLEQKTAGIPGVAVAKKAIREYQSGSGLAHIMGYTGIVSPADIAKNPNYYLSDRIGKVGLESSYESYLKGTHGVEQIEVDSKGNVVKVMVDEQNKDPIAGDDLSLYLDLGLQEATATALRSGMASGEALTGQKVNGGVAIVMDVRTGGILSMVSLPDYDNNLFAAKISTSDYQNLINDATLPMFNRAIGGTYPPGSISKIILASAGLSEGNITVNTAFDTPAEIKIGDFTFPDWKDHGYSNVVKAIAESNNIFFYSVGGGYGPIKGLGIDTIKKYWQIFGLGEKTGIDIPGEASGLLPDEAWKERVRKEPWYIGDTYHVSIGQGDLLVTPLQMLRATAAIANNGTLLEPQLVKKITDLDGKTVQEFGPRVERSNIVSQSVLSTVQQGMKLTITGGSAQNLNNLSFTLAGKTGTAQFLNNEKTHAWFTAYAPAENPEVAIIVLVDGGGGGHEIAAPVAKDILSYYFSHK